MSNQFWLQSAQDGLVFDIKEPVASGSALQTLVQKNETNQYWALEAVPGQPGYFWIVSADNGLVVDIKEPVASGSALQALVQKNEANQYWKLVPVPGQPGYSWIVSADNGLVVDIKVPVASGSELQALVQKNETNQYWKTVSAPLPPGLKSLDYASIAWGPEGTGPAPNSPTACSGGNECAYQVGLTIRSDGSYTFSGYYQNRGDVAIVTAPPQAFVVTFTVYDVDGNAYPFGYSGTIPSAPQNGSIASWNQTGSSAAIALNWDSISTKNDGKPYVWNYYSESWTYFIGNVLGSAMSAVEDAVEDVGKAFEWIYENWSSDDDDGDGDDDGDDPQIASRVPPPGAKGGAASLTPTSSAGTPSSSAVTVG
jgi:Ricin-type beta-trefoil lectin domain-like